MPSDAAERRRAAEAEGQLEALREESGSRARQLEEAAEREEALNAQLAAVQQELLMILTRTSIEEWPLFYSSLKTM